MFQCRSSAPAPSTRQVVCIPCPIDAPVRRSVTGDSSTVTAEAHGAYAVLPSRMPMSRNILITPFAFLVFATLAIGQTPSTPPPQRPSYQDRFARLVNPPTGAWTADQLATMARLRDAALKDPYALDQLR